MIAPGQMLGDYEIVAPLGAGGMASLFLARRRGPAGFARQIALKVLHPHLAGDARLVQMLIDEAKLASRIQHPNVVRVEELGHSRGVYFLVMEYVPGVALWALRDAAWARGVRMPTALAVWVAIQTADGLHAAHETVGDAGDLLGVVHRDVSPQNVLVSASGQVRLIDFGIAKARGRAQHTTREGVLKGKLAYMSPEQACGLPVDRRTDVYALGVVLWELLTSQRLFDADDELALLAHVRDPVIVPPSRLAPTVPAAVDAAVLAALAREPSARPATAQQFREQLAAALPEALALEPRHLAAFVAEVGARPSIAPQLEPTPATTMVTRPDAAPLRRSTPVTDSAFEQPAVHALLAPRASEATGALIAPVHVPADPQHARPDQTDARAVASAHQAERALDAPRSTRRTLARASAALGAFGALATLLLVARAHAPRATSTAAAATAPHSPPPAAPRRESASAAPIADRRATQSLQPEHEPEAVPAAPAKTSMHTRRPGLRRTRRAAATHGGGGYLRRLPLPDVAY